MKVLFLTNIPSPYRVDFFNELGKQCDLTVLYELKRASNRNERWNANGSKNFREIFLSGKKIGVDSAICFSVLKYLKDKSYDIIVVGGYSTPTGMLAIEFLNFINRPFILNVDGGMIKNESKIKFNIKKHFISSATAWLSTGETTNKYLIHYGAKKDNIFLYPFTSIKEEDILQNPIIRDDKAKFKLELGISENKVIISVGQFIHRKGFDVLIKAIRNLPKDIGVYIIGGIPTKEYLELKEIHNLQNLYFIDFKSKEELAKYYKASDIFVLPTREDIWGLVVNEAMAFGLPIITTNKCVAGMELINNNGYIISNENYEELEIKILEIVNDDNILLKLSSKSIEIIKNYTIERMVQTHYNIFKTFIKKRSRKKYKGVLYEKNV